MNRWEKKVVAITGAASGIGRALAWELDAREARLALSDVQVGELAETAAACTEARTYELDVADRDAVLAHAAEVADDFGSVDVIVNNAGVALAATVAEQSFEDLDWLLGINLGGVINGTQAFLPHILESQGNVVNISSAFGLVAVPGQSAYNASKFAVRGYTEALRMEMEMAGTGVGVHCVHPGGIATNIAKSARGADRLADGSTTERFDRMALRTPPEKAARDIIRGVERNCRRIHVGIDAQVAGLAERVLGSQYQRVIPSAARRILPQLGNA